MLILEINISTCIFGVEMRDKYVVMRFSYIDMLEKYADMQLMSN